MSGIDFLILLMVAALIFFALRRIKRTAKNGGCSGCAHSCGSGSCECSFEADAPSKHLDE